MNVNARGQRWHKWALLLLCVVGLIRGLYWVGTLAFWNHIDEMQHFGYVESLATGDGMPVVGHDLLSDEVSAIALVGVCMRSSTAPTSVRQRRRRLVRHYGLGFGAQRRIARRPLFSQAHCSTAVVAARRSGLKPVVMPTPPDESP